jgi:hypothetical protein
MFGPADIQHAGLGSRGEHREKAIHAPSPEADEHEMIEGLKCKFHLPFVDMPILDMPMLEDSRQDAQKEFRTRETLAHYEIEFCHGSVI